MSSSSQGAGAHDARPAHAAPSRERFLAIPCRSMNLTALQITIISLIGLLGGTLGGLLGLGGSVFIIPALTLLLGANQHLFQASALLTNVFVGTGASLRHRGKGTIRMDLVPAMLASSMLTALGGVWASNLIAPQPLSALFGLFLCYASGAEFLGIWRAAEEPHARRRQMPALWLGVAVGSAGGMAAGLLGIGGGAVMVPMLRRLGGVPVREAVASTAMAMIGACAVGATAKNLAIPSLTDQFGTPLTVQQALLLAALLGPTASVGAVVGAGLVYRLPIRITRGLLALLLAFAGIRMLVANGPHVLAALQSSLSDARP